MAKKKQKNVPQKRLKMPMHNGTKKKKKTQNQVYRSW
jgi:hypothetical protein